MTEQEAIEMMQGYQITDAVDRAEYDAFQMAIDALKKIQKFKNIGISSVDELLLHKADEVILNQYKAIGTVDECREAKEKQRVKQVILYGDCEDGKLICPSCSKDLWDLKECGFDYCPYCGQAIEWGEDK